MAACSAYRTTHRTGNHTGNRHMLGALQLDHVELTMKHRCSQRAVLACSLFLLCAYNLGANRAMADNNCGISSGSVRILGNDFPALHALTTESLHCRDDSTDITVNLNNNYKSLMVPALSAQPAGYTSVLIANGSLVTLMNDELIQPMDSFIAKFGGALPSNQKISINGQVMAIAFIVNAQHLFYRKDILDAAGLDVPQHYDQVLQAAKIIKEKGLMKYPLGGSYKAGWDLGEEFVNMYLGTGADFFKAGSVLPAVNNQQGVRALAMMKALTEYMNPDFLSHGSDTVQAEWEAGNTALANLWGTRAGAVIDNEGSTPAIANNTQFANAPSLIEGSTPAASLWWVGFSLAKNISDEDAEATFKTLLASMSKNLINQHAEKAVWLINGYVPDKASIGTLAVANSGAEPYPMSPTMGLLHNAAGQELVQYLQGEESAEQALADLEAAYRASAIAAGFLKQDANQD